MDKIDWFKANERSRRKYEHFMSSLDGLGLAIEEAEVVVGMYTAAASTRPVGRGFMHVEPEELKGALNDLYESLNALVAKARRNEAKLKSWEWQV
ncbi:hypothetical protein [Glycomyces xiaoerkulensis]|uniref:hypothetical protein n=1 Tax=Glycomyces xiaoerkulensis TaxID=2038139 RepID=UPI000C2666CB|nr:hypothetical protein [Glycomyces xiaoerkulensis]